MNNLPSCIALLLEAGAPMITVHGMRPSVPAGRRYRSAGLVLNVKEVETEAIEYAIGAGHVDCVLAFLEGGAGQGLGYDAVGRTLASLHRAGGQRASVYYPACLGHVLGAELAGDSQHGQLTSAHREGQILNHRRAAAVRIKKWWREHGAQFNGRRVAAATKIQAWYRSHRTRLWLSRVIKAHEEPGTTIGAGGIAAFFDSDAHLGLVGEVIASFADLGTAIHVASAPSAVPDGTDHLAPPPPPPPRKSVSKFPAYLQKTRDGPLLVRCRPVQSAPIVGLVMGGPSRVLQTYYTNVTFTEHRPERVWIRLANPGGIFGDQQAWVVMRHAATATSVFSQLLQPATSFGRSATGSTGIFNGGTDLADPCCDDCVVIDSDIFPSGKASAVQLKATPKGAECMGCGRIAKLASGSMSAGIGIGAQPSVCFVELALRAYRGGARKVLSRFGCSARCAQHLVQTPTSCQQRRLGRRSVLQLAALENNVPVIAVLLEHSKQNCLDVLLGAGPDNALLLACASGATGAAISLIEAIRAARDESRLAPTPAGPPSGYPFSKTSTAERPRQASAAVELLRSAACVALATRSWLLIEALIANGTRLETVVDVNAVAWHGALLSTDPEKYTAMVTADLEHQGTSTPLGLLLRGFPNQAAQKRDFAAVLKTNAPKIHSTNPFSSFFARASSGTDTSGAVVSANDSAEDVGNCSSTATNLADLDRLVAMGCPVDATGLSGVTALMQLLRDGNVDMASVLMQRGACDTIPDAQGRSAWWHAARAGNMAGLEMMFRFKFNCAKAALFRGDLVQAEDMIDRQYGLNSWAVGGAATWVPPGTRAEVSPLHAAIINHTTVPSDSSKNTVAVLEFLINRGCRVPREGYIDVVRQLRSAGLAASAGHLLRAEMERLAASFGALIQQRHRLESSPSNDSDLAYTAFKMQVDCLRHILMAVKVIQGDTAAEADVEAIMTICAGSAVSTAVRIEYVRHCCGRQTRFGQLSAVLPWGHAGIATALFEMLFGPSDLSVASIQDGNYVSASASALSQDWLPQLLESVHEHVLMGQWRAVLSVVLAFPDKTTRLSTLASLALKLEEEAAIWDEAKVLISESIDIGLIIEKDQHSSNDTVRKAARDFVGQLFPDQAVKCGVCLGPIINTMPCCQQTGGEHYKKVSCKHEYCKVCLVPWIECQLAESCAQIGCPHEECAFNFNGEDVRRIAGDVAYTQFLNITTRDYQARLADASSGLDKKTTEWLNKNTRVCPSCSVVIERSAGCNSMKCFTCGNRFNWSDAKTMKDSVKPDAPKPNNAAADLVNIAAETPWSTLWGGIRTR